MSEKPKTIDDSRFSEITRRVLEGRREEAAEDSGIDLETVGRLAEQPAEVASDLTASLVVAMEERDWLSYQMIEGHYVRPVIVLQANVRAVAAVSANGRPVFSEQVLAVVTVAGQGRFSDSTLQVLADLTPVWHPQVSERGAVRLLGEWEGWGEALDSFRELIQYETYDCAKSVLAPEAAVWARSNPSRFPVHEVTGERAD